MSNSGAPISSISVVNEKKRKSLPSWMDPKNEGRVVLSGNQAYVRGAIESNVQFLSTYPGTPTSEIGDQWSIYAKFCTNRYIKYDLSVNETIAFEAAVGASWAGIRSIVSFKHLGLNLISDALHTVMYAGLNGEFGAGLVIICGGDPDILSSTNAQDDRLFSFHTYLPILQPRDLQECKDFVSLAFSLSEKIRLPVMIYSSTKMHHSSGIVKLNSPLGVFSNSKYQIKDLFTNKFSANRSKLLNAIHWARNNHTLLLEKIKTLQKIKNKEIKIDTLKINPKNKNLKIIEDNIFSQLYRIEGNMELFLEFSEFVTEKNSSNVSKSNIDKKGKDIHKELDDKIDLINLKVGFICTGLEYSYLSELSLQLGLPIPILSLSLTYPLPEIAVLDFIEQLKPDLLIIIEEQESFIEKQIKEILYNEGIYISIVGKSLFSRIGSLNTDNIIDSLGKKFEWVSIGRKKHFGYFKSFRKLINPGCVLSSQNGGNELILPVREPSFCPGCSHRVVFYALRKAVDHYEKKSGRSPIFGGDIGCYTMSMSKPYETMDWLICMGAGVGISNGIASVIDSRKQHVVALIGDSTFFHSGIQAIINLAKNNKDVTVIILDNYFSAMTGHQLSPSTPKRFRNNPNENNRINENNIINGKKKRKKTENISKNKSNDKNYLIYWRQNNERISIEKLLNSLGDFKVFRLNGYGVHRIQHQLESAFSIHGLKFVLIESECALHKIRRIKHQKKKLSNAGISYSYSLYSIKDSCVKCDECFERLGCTAINIANGRYFIDQSRCLSDDCNACLEVCPNSAIVKTEINPHLKRFTEFNTYNNT